MNETDLPISCHSSVRLDNYVIIIGGRWNPGCGKGGKPRSTRKLWMYNLYTEGWREYAIPKHVIARSGLPEPFHFAVAVAINGTIYTFGGADYVGSRTRNELWTLSKAKTGCFTWRSIKPQCDKESPSPRRAYTGWEYAQKLWVFGGIGPSLEGYLHDHGDITSIGVGHPENNQLLCYVPNTQKWTNPPGCGEVPSPRACHSSTIINDKVWIFGGLCRGCGLLDDMFELTMHSLTWTQIQTVQPRPQARQLSTLTALTNNQLVLHGGLRGYNEALSDTWIMDLTSHLWTQFTSRKDHPLRYHAGSLGLNNNVIIIGGCKSSYPHKSYKSVFHVMLEAKSLQQLAMQTTYKHQDEINWNCLPNKLISLLGLSIKEKNSNAPSQSHSLHSV